MALFRCVARLVHLKRVLSPLHASQNGFMSTVEVSPESPLTKVSLAGYLYVGAITGAVREHKSRFGSLDVTVLLAVTKRLSQLKLFHFPSRWNEHITKHKSEVDSFVRDIEKSSPSCDLDQLLALTSSCDVLGWLDEDSDISVLKVVCESCSHTFLKGSHNEETLRKLSAFSWPSSVLKCVVSKIDLKSLNPDMSLAVVDILGRTPDILPAEKIADLKQSLVKNMGESRDVGNQLRLIRYLYSLGDTEHVEDLCRGRLISELSSSSVIIDDHVVQQLGYLFPYANDSAGITLLFRTVVNKPLSHMSKASQLTLLSYALQLHLVDSSKAGPFLVSTGMRLSDASEPELRAFCSVISSTERITNFYLLNRFSRDIWSLLESERAKEFSPITKVKLFIAAVVTQGGRVGTQFINQQVYREVLPSIRLHLDQLTPNELAWYCFRILTTLKKHNNVVTERWQCVSVIEPRIKEFSVSNISSILYGLFRIETNLTSAFLKLALDQATVSANKASIESLTDNLCSLFDVLGWVVRRPEYMSVVAEFIGNNRASILRLYKEAEAVSLKGSRSISIMNQGLRNLNIADKRLLQDVASWMDRPLPPLLDPRMSHAACNYYGFFVHYGLYTVALDRVYKHFTVDFKAAQNVLTREDLLQLVFDCLTFHRVPVEALRYLVETTSITNIVSLSHLAQMKVLALDSYIRNFYPGMQFDQTVIQLSHALLLSRSADSLRVADFHGSYARIGMRKLVMAARSLYSAKTLLCNVASGGGDLSLLSLLLHPDTMEAIPWDHPEVIKHIQVFRVSKSAPESTGSTKSSSDDMVVPAEEIKDSFIELFLQSEFSSTISHVALVDTEALRQRGLRPVFLYVFSEHVTSYQSEIILLPGLSIVNGTRLCGWETVPLCFSRLVGCTAEDMALYFKSQISTFCKKEDLKCWQENGAHIVAPPVCESEEAD